jgi:hypothetical protein
MKKFLLFIVTVILSQGVYASQLLIPMDKEQKNHLKAYGIAYWILKKDVQVYWLLNYRGGSFMFNNDKSFIDELTIRGVSYEVIADAKSNAILSEISNPEVNMDAVKLEMIIKK